MNITLGGLIKTYRINKRLSQFDVALAIGWKDTSRLSKIEQGRVKPTRPVVEKIMAALNLSSEERGEFLLTGGYLPSDEEITKVIKIVKENPGLFINNAIENIKSAKFINPTAFYGIDTPLNKATSLEDIQKNGSGSLVTPLIKKYFLWLVLLALWIIVFFNSQKQFRMFLLLIAQNIYLVLIVCLYFPNYLYFMSGYIPSWILLFSLSLAIILQKLLSRG